MSLYRLIDANIAYKTKSEKRWSLNATCDWEW